ncbi:hypothetical protein TPHA_0D00580 [Tetrapisispora phaffii CBS 4417]|uniref:F-box domain-containing protein n=1 Tax=Tetrapisispora phaffii (strain ATCC 24235 / CBS 4417 / NBRC 1672 / NRRL Y-8282 / UCD 70-5) TaxID=1071381 RepID=G8BS81_TETPH|nr:hypothetical protein TPHA_0D00580 [Tetrapisispora phaffii CBS 4417]CCE62702.1 hypothetical protein TPHA_0D00580 [Tetrapisispora phaffii CBS 4417]
MELLNRPNVLATPLSGDFETNNSVTNQPSTTDNLKNETAESTEVYQPNNYERSDAISNRANTVINSASDMEDLGTVKVCTPASSFMVNTDQIGGSIIKESVDDSSNNTSSQNNQIGQDAIADDTLPPSPVASPVIIFPVESSDEENKIVALTKDKNTSPLIDFGTTTVESLQNLTDELLHTLQTDFQSKQCYKNILFNLIAQMNRSDLSDLGTLLKDNLKRDFITTLPIEITLKVLRNLDFQDIQNCSLVTKSWNSLLTSTAYIWKMLLIKENFISRQSFSKYFKTLSLKYPEIGTDYEKGYRLDFLRNYKFLKNWYNVNFTPEVTSLPGHLTSVITCLQFEDNRIITGADDKMIRIYDAVTKKFVNELRGHNGGVWALKYDENGILVSGSTDRSVRIWDIDLGVCTHVFKGHTSTVRCLHIVKYKNIKYVVTGSRDNTLHVWKLPNKCNTEDKDKYPIVYDSTEENPYFVGILRGHLASVRTVSGYGNIIISGSYDNTLMVWDIIKMKCLYILTGHINRIYSTIYDHKRNRCISASMDSTIRVWDLANIQNNGTCTEVMNSMVSCVNVTGSMYTLQGHTALVGLLKLSDKFLVSAAADGSLRGWDANTYSRKFTYHHNNLSAITTFDMNDNLLVSGSEGQFNVYNLRTGKLIHSNILRADHIWSVQFKENILVVAIEFDRKSYVEILDFNIPCSSTATTTATTTATLTSSTSSSITSSSYSTSATASTNHQ